MGPPESLSALVRLRLGIGALTLILLLSVGVFSCFGILSAAFILLFKRTSPIALLMEGAAWLLGGVLYPVTVLPDWLRRCSNLPPRTRRPAAPSADLRWRG